jgi:hypothetical protein
MKQPKKLTRAMKEMLSKLGLKPTEWMYTRQTNRYLIIIHKQTKERKVLANG